MTGFLYEPLCDCNADTGWYARSRRGHIKMPDIRNASWI
ncbi:hypothetical protein ASZ90_016390 [hydrocarbon metagenome]|uniref:Uncharacterized protein n=1 Tax=hydrocarbon metagenome TaxID=938273 RepID=A0A0W8EXG3_9ZZZZ